MTKLKSKDEQRASRTDAPMCACDVVPNAAVASMVSYRVPRAAKPIDLYLDSNEGAQPDQSVLDELAAIDAQTIRRYPSKLALEALLAERFSISERQVIVTAGGDDAIDRCCRAMLGPGREILLPVPTFEMIARSARLAHGEIIEIEWFDQPFPTDEILARIDERTATITMVTPNNPTGAIIALDDLERIAAAAPRALVLVDLAYIEFAQRDITQDVLQIPNAVVIRTFSKAFGMAGLRVGYALGPEPIIGWLRAAGSPYPVSGPSLRLALQALRASPKGDASFFPSVRRERDSISNLLKEKRVRVLPSEANFVLAEFDDALAVRDTLAEGGISVRAFPGDPRLASWLRITCPGDPRSFERLAAALTEILDQRKRS